MTLRNCMKISSTLYKRTANISVDKATILVEDRNSAHLGQVIFRANSSYTPNKKLDLPINF